MKANKRGLSTIVVTLIIILISLVAVGIVWVVVNNLIKGGAGSAEIAAKCIGVTVEATAVNCSKPTGNANYMCTVQLMRSGTEGDAIGGVKLIFRNSTSGASSPLIGIEGNIEALVGKRITGTNTSFTAAGASKLETTAYFTDDSGVDTLCPQKDEFTNLVYA